MCTNLVGMASLILVLKFGETFLLDHGLYQFLWSVGVKNGIESNGLKKFVQVGVVMQCMCTNFEGRSLSSFGDIAIIFFQILPNFPFRP